MTNEEQIENILHKKRLLLPTEKFSWESHSYYVAEYCPHLFDPIKYNWKRYSYSVTRYCSDKIDADSFNWTKASSNLILHHPNHKYISHCIWSEKNINEVKYSSINYSNRHPIWEKYLGEIDDLLDPTKRETLLNKIAKAIKLSKI